MPLMSRSISEAEMLPWMKDGCGCGGQKLDGFAWPAGFSASPYGAGIGLRTNQPRLLAELRSLLLAPNWSAAHDGQVDYLYSLWIPPEAAPRGFRHYHLLYSQSKLVARSLQRGSVFRELRRRFFDHVALTGGAGKLLFVRAGVVEWGGKALLIPGRAALGKSRLVQALVACGAGYRSDHFALLDRRGRVHPFPCSLALWGDSDPIPASAMSELSLEPIPLGGIAALNWQSESQGPWSAMSPAEMVQCLYNSCIRMRAPRATLDTLVQACTGIAGWSGPRGEADQAASQILQRL